MCSNPSYVKEIIEYHTHRIEFFTFLYLNIYFLFLMSVITCWNSHHLKTNRFGEFSRMNSAWPLIFFYNRNKRFLFSFNRGEKRCGALKTCVFRVRSQSSFQPAVTFLELPENNTKLKGGENEENMRRKNCRKLVDNDPWSRPCEITYPYKTT